LQLFSEVLVITLSTSEKTMSGLLLILLTVAVILLVAWGGFWLVDRVGLPHPINMIAKAVIAIIALWALLERTGMLNGLG